MPRPSAWELAPDESVCLWPDDSLAGRVLADGRWFVFAPGIARPGKADSPHVKAGRSVSPRGARLQVERELAALFR